MGTYYVYILLLLSILNKEWYTFTYTKYFEMGETDVSYYCRNRK